MRLIAVLVLLGFFSATGADSLYLGRLDTIGGTTYDWQSGGPAQRRCCRSPGAGVYAAWLSAQTELPWPDRNGRYNFWDETSREWAFIEPYFMSSGMVIFGGRPFFCELDVAPGSGDAWAIAHVGTVEGVKPIVANLTRGEFIEGPEGFRWPALAVGQGDIVHLAMMDDSTEEGLWYSRAPFDTVVEFAQPGFIYYTIAASKVSERVAVFWVETESVPSVVLYRVSTDAGLTWEEPTRLEPPPAFGPDTVPVISWFGHFPLYDLQDRLHIVVAVVPRVRESSYVQPVEIWHWCPDNAPAWSRIHRAGCDPSHLMAWVGYNVNYADRPSIGVDALGRLYVAWEQFDSANVEPATNLLRAGIWLAGSSDNGRTWNPGLRLTPENTVSHRFPCVIDRPGLDTVGVAYMMDSMAGFNVLTQGVCSRNPIVVQWVAAQTIGVAEGTNPGAFDVRAGTTIVRGVLRIASRAELVDATGRRVTGLQPGANELRHLSPGVYFVRELSAESCQRLVLSKVIMCGR